MKKTLIFFLCVALLLPLFQNNVASAAQKTNDMDPMVLSVDEADSSLLSFLCSQNCTIKADSIIQIDVLDSNNGIAIAVINEIDNQQKQVEVLLVVNDNDDESSVALNNQNLITSSGDYYNFYQGKIIIKGCAVYNTVADGNIWFYQPQRAKFYYTKQQTCTVQYIEMIYITTGILYTYPGFTMVSSNVYDHYVFVSKTNPYANTIYSGSNPLASNRCIDTATGLYSGMSLYFEFTVDNVSDYYNLVIG